jgi:hypothetical protein
VHPGRLRLDRILSTTAGNDKAEGTAPSFERDIRPLFREDDVLAMSFILDLSSYAEVRDNAESIYDRIEDGTMPCDIPWEPEQLALLRRWIDAGMQA